MEDYDEQGDHVMKYVFFDNEELRTLKTDGRLGQRAASKEVSVSCGLY